MNNPREPFDRLFDQFNENFARAAERENFAFDAKAGPNISRSLRMECGRLKKGVFLEIKDHWMESDPHDPKVTFTYGVWFSPTKNAFPFYLLVKPFYEGKISGLQPIEKWLEVALSEVKTVSEELVIKNGKLFEDTTATDK